MHHTCLKVPYVVCLSVILSLNLTGCASLSYKVARPVIATQLQLTPPEFSVRIERNVPLTTSDGTILYANIYYPKRLSKTPTILLRIPLRSSTINQIRSDIFCRIWAERGFTVVMQITRGYPPSRGNFEPFRHERQDGIETLQWISKQPWYDGHIGMWGGSYFGYTQWAVADQSDPGPDVFLISIASSDWYRMLYPGGAFSLTSALYWAVWSDEKTVYPPSVKVLKKGYAGLPLIDADDRVRRDISFFNQWVMHPKRDTYWSEIDGAIEPKSVAAPVLLMAGWYDPFLPGMLDDYVEIRKETKPEIANASSLMIGPWAHARTVKLPGRPRLKNYRLEAMAPSLDWFDQYLKNKNVGLKRNPPLRIFVMGKNVWRDENEWPLARTLYTSYYLKSGGNANSAEGDGSLEFTPADSELSDSYVYDPQNPVPTAGGAMFGPEAGTALQNDIEKRSDVLIYTTAPLDEDLEITGPVKLILYVSTTAPSTDFTAKLVDVHPNGAAYNISDGILRRSYERKGPTEIEIELWPTSNVFLNGHRIRLEVSSSNYPRFDRNPNTGREIATEEHPVKAEQTIFYDAQRPSCLILPVIPNGDAPS